MKSRITRHITQAALLASVLLVTGLSARPASAQGRFEGKFTLPYEVRWGRATLPAGDYQLVFVDNTLGTLLAIRDAKTLRILALEPVNNREDSHQGTSALLVGTHGKQHVVYSLTIAELGECFVYERPPAHNREFEEEARNSQAVPVTVAKK
jgi:hypothetical protein